MKEPLRGSLRVSRISRFCNTLAGIVGGATAGEYAGYDDGKGAVARYVAGGAEAVGAGCGCLVRRMTPR